MNKVKVFWNSWNLIFWVGIFSFNLHVYYLSRYFICWTRAFNLPTRGFSLETRGFQFVTRGFELVTRWLELVTHGFELVTCRFEIASRLSELITRNSQTIWKRIRKLKQEQMNSILYFTFKEVFSNNCTCIKTWKRNTK